MIRRHFDYFKYLFKVDPWGSLGVAFDVLFILVTCIKILQELIHGGGVANNIVHLNQITWVDRLFSWVLLSQVLRVLSAIIKILYLRYKWKKEAKSMNIFNEDFDFKNLQISDKEKSNEYHLESYASNSSTIYVLSSSLINQKLKKSEFKIIRLNKNGFKQVFNNIKHRKNVLVPFLTFQYFTSIRDGKSFFNEQKLCLSCDIGIKDLEVVCHKGSYFDSYLTNEVSGKYLAYMNDPLNIVADARNYTSVVKKNSQYIFKDITSSYFNNHIGVSTIALTNDNYIVLWRQNQKNIVHAGTIVSTGSGSCDFADLVRENGHYSFPKTIICAMERELREENKLGGDAKVKETIILGYFRWLSRGGKPEFVGVSFLDMPLIDLFGNDQEVFERIEIYFASKEEIPYKVNEFLSNSNNLSVPLLINLHHLKKHFE
jgi:hypothetical protein